MGAILYVLMNKLSQHLSVRSERLVADVCFLSVGLVIFFPRCCSRVYVVPLIIIYENKFLVTLSHLVFLQNPYKKKLLFSIQKTRKTLLTQCIYIYLFIFCWWEFVMDLAATVNRMDNHKNHSSLTPLTMLHKSCKLQSLTHPHSKPRT